MKPDDERLTSSIANNSTSYIIKSRPWIIILNVAGLHSSRSIFVPIDSVPLANDIWCVLLLESDEGDIFILVDTIPLADNVRWVIGCISLEMMMVSDVGFGMDASGWCR